MKKNRQHLQKYSASQAASQRGAVLLVGVIMLIVITLLSIAAIQTTTLQARMAGNMVDRNLAFQSAESGLSFFEIALKYGKEWSGEDGYYDHDGAGSVLFPPADLAADTSWEKSLHTYEEAILSGRLAEPRGIVEKMAPRVPVMVGEPVTTDEFRVTVRGTGYGGNNAKSKVVLQTYFVRYR